MYYPIVLLILVHYSPKHFTMKKLFFLALLCFLTSVGYAQYSNIIINNTTACPVYLELRGGLPGSTCATANYGSGVLLIPAAAFLNYNPATVPGGMNCGGCIPPTLGTTGLFWSALVYKTPPPCPPSSTFDLQDNACLVYTSVQYTSYNTACTSCFPDVTVTWANMGTFIMITIS